MKNKIFLFGILALSSSLMIGGDKPLVRKVDTEKQLSIAFKNEQDKSGPVPSELTNLQFQIYPKNQRGGLEQSLKNKYKYSTSPMTHQGILQNSLCSVPGCIGKVNVLGISIDSDAGKFFLRGNIAGKGQLLSIIYEQCDLSKINLDALDKTHSFAMIGLQNHGYIENMGGGEKDGMVVHIIDFELSDLKKVMVGFVPKKVESLANMQTEMHNIKRVLFSQDWDPSNLPKFGRSNSLEATKKLAIHFGQHSGQMPLSLSDVEFIFYVNDDSFYQQMQKKVPKAWGKSELLNNIIYHDGILTGTFVTNSIRQLNIEISGNKGNFLFGETEKYSADNFVKHIESLIQSSENVSIAGAPILFVAIIAKDESGKIHVVRCSRESIDKIMPSLNPSIDQPVEESTSINLPKIEAFVSPWLVRGGLLITFAALMYYFGGWDKIKHAFGS